MDYVDQRFRARTPQMLAMLYPEPAEASEVWLFVREQLRSLGGRGGPLRLLKKRLVRDYNVGLGLVYEVGL